jgi:hypothetical protein
MHAMKRAIFGKTLLICIALTACSPSAPPRTAEADADSAAGWTRPPEITVVQRAQGVLLFSGEAEPGSRVVLRSESGAAYAAAADAEGRFEIRMAAPTGDLLLQPETQIGQDAAPSPDRLLILAGGRGPIAILRAGGPTRRLDPAPALGAVDSDGRMRLASGRSSTGAEPIPLQAGGETGLVTPDSAGRWRLVLSPSDGADEIRVGEQTFIWPGESGDAAPTGVERAGRGWRVIWTGPGGARQATWLPDAG